MTRTHLGGIVMLVGLFITTTAHMVSQEPLDGPKRIFQDALFDNLVGNWKMTGKVMGRPVEYSFKSEWILNHQFLQLHLKDINNPPTYEAIVYIGYDNTSERYVAHWVDVFGGRTSETLGFGARSGNSTKFVFEYPDGPFHNTFNWQPEAKTWNFLLERKVETGKWTVFAEYNLRRAS